jgi:hypothetical protein
VTDFLDDKRKEINDRLAVLKPEVDEYERLQAAASALAKVGGATRAASAPAGGRGPAVAPAASAPAPRRKKGPGRPRGSRTRRKAAKAAAAPAAAAAPEAATPIVERKKPGRPKGSGKKVGRPAGKVGRSKGKVGRRKGSGTRAAQALSFVQGQPGITIPELAAKMGIKQNYLYRVLPGLEQDGTLEKNGRGWHPKGS